MKIHQILNGVGIVINNEEHEFIDRNGETVYLNMLDEHSQWVAQNLVRKGVYGISKDKSYIKKND